MTPIAVQVETRLRFGSQETGRLRILYVVETAGPEWGSGLRGRVPRSPV